MTNPRKIVSRDSACLDRYTSIGIHANHMNMTKFLSDQDPDYQNILSELRRFIQPYEQITGSDLQSEHSILPENQGLSIHGTSNKGSSKTEPHQNTIHAEEKPYQPGRLVNNFSGAFNTSGGRIFLGNEYNTGGGSMTF